MNADDWMIAAYDRVVAAAGNDGISLKDARDRVAQQYEGAVRQGTIDIPDTDYYTEGAQRFDRVIRPHRQSRKNSLHRDMEVISAALRGETILGEDDPALHLAYPLGTVDGRDKILTLWTREDWRNAAMTRYRNAAESTAAAQIFEEQSTLIAQRMLAKGVDKTGELFTASEDGVA